MITNLVNNVQAQIIRRNELEKRQENKKDIAESYQKLVNISQLLRETIASFQLIKPRLTDNQVTEATGQIRAIHIKLKESHEKFTTQFRQIRELMAIEKSVQDLQSFLNQAWASYVLIQTRPHFDLLDLVENLPEVSIQGGIVTPVRQRLQAHSNKLPRRETHLTQFDADLQALQNSLANLSGLDLAVTEFLRRVQKGTASVADLTDEVLAWCQENERARVFKISFRQTR